MGIEGKVALVTGAGQGIGRGIALRLARDGADICLVDVKAEKIEAVAGEIRALGRKATTVVADISRRDEVFAAVDHAEKTLGGFDVMVNNAGICQVNPLSEVTQEEVERIYGINVQGTLWASRLRRPSSRHASRRARSSTPARSPGTRATRCWACIRQPSSRCAR
jgi:meso-butanediol dehydrogenase/(S,S)-butanediol dehydrogenase/diacetyl reductase